MQFEGSQCFLEVKSVSEKSYRRDPAKDGSFFFLALRHLYPLSLVRRRQQLTTPLSRFVIILAGWFETSGNDGSCVLCMCGAWCARLAAESERDKGTGVGSAPVTRCGARKKQAKENFAEGVVIPI